jgi:ATP-dependent Clp protease ATP-binding subunit ClpA
MPGPFDRFNDRAKRVLALAQDEAIRFNHDYIGPEHLILGLVREGEGAAARALDAVGIKLSQLRSKVELLIGRGEATASPSEIVLHPRTKRIIEFAVDEARKLGHSQVGTEHLLLGILREGDSMATRAVESFGVTIEKVRAQVVSALGEPAAPPRAPRVPSMPFGRASASIYNVLTLAREEAMALGHEWIGSEHLLLALLRPAMAFTMRPLLSVGVTYENALAQVAAVVPRKDAKPANAELTPRAYEMIGYAKGFADASHGVDGTRGLLVALIADDVGVASQVLMKLGTTPRQILDAMDRS